ncbi:MAG: putative lipid II flippase FtsW [Eubacteriales bacterium]|nr:putative lipid II flippase FtsW [Eubacteriales bacterium]
MARSLKSSNSRNNSRNNLRAGTRTNTRTSTKTKPRDNIRNFENEVIEEITINEGKVDPIITISMVILVTLGVIMVFSASYYFAQTRLKKPDITYFFKRQGIFALIGFSVLPLVTKIDWRIFRRFSFIAFCGCLFLSTIVLIPGIGIEANGARRWLGIGSFQFQPAELTKIGLILYLSAFLEKNKNILNTWAGFLRTCFILGIPFALIGLENASTAIIVGVIGMSIMFVASPRLDYFVFMAIAAILGLAAMFLFGDTFRLERFQAWLDPFAEGVSNDTGFQTVQSLYAIASGGFFGLGIGQGRQKLGFIPEGHNDIIFSVICEELGVAGALLFIILFAMIIWRGYIIAIKAPKTYMTYVCTGITTMIAIQVIINIAVVTNTIPNTGIPLPFVSYGGTSLLILMASTGIILNFSRYFTDD